MHGLIRAVLTLTGLHGRGRRNVLNIQRRENQVWLKRLPPAFEGYTLLHLSDLHLDMSPAHVERLIESVRGLKHDVCVLTGDFRFRTFGPYAPALEALARLRPHLGERVHAVLGNHDTIRMVSGIEALGIGVLMNESVQIERDGDPIALVGIDDAHYYRTHDFHRALTDVPPHACTILLSHTPEPYRHAAHSDISLMLCGHTHGGQICLPGGIPIIIDCDAPRAMARGPWQHHDMVGYTSVGCGSSVVDVRLNCLPEITLHRLHRG
jgi:predicted MPP superfamily phosphohydrolase